MSVDTLPVTEPEITTEPRRRRPLPASVLATLLLVGLTGLGVVSMVTFAPPDAAPAGISPAEFSAGRAAAHVDQIAQRPHPVGTAEHERVRQYIVDAATAAGAEVTVESAEVTRPDWGSPFPSALVHNVVATVPGNAPAVSGGKALLLVAHYDSVPVGPGASDDGAAVSAMLETMRALRAGGGVDNDVVFLFSDGEELGALGATAFIDRHGVDGFGAVLNWEARGSSGPVLMFETGAGNLPLVDAFADASSRPIANSLAYEVYRRLPNGTDFTSFLNAGATGLNAAFIEGVHDYDAPTDTPARLSKDSMQHHGESMLGMIHELGSTDLRTMSGSNAVYFDLFARLLVVYPSGWAVGFAVVSLAVLCGLVVVGARRSALRARGVLAVAGVGVGTAAAIGVLCFGLWSVVMGLRPEFATLPLSEPYGRAGFTAGFAVITVAVLLLAAQLLRGRPLAELVAGGLTLLGVLLAASVVAVPGASYLVQWPLAAGLPALWFVLGGHRAGLVLTAAAPAVAVVLFIPMLHSLLVTLGVALAGIAMALAALAGLLLFPLLAQLPRPRLTAGGTAAIAVTVLFTSVGAAGFSAEEPRPDSLVYATEADGTARWLSGDPAPDAWTDDVLGDEPGTVDATRYFPNFPGEELLAAPAPEVPIAPPTLTVLADTTDGPNRTVRFHVASQRAAWRLQVRLPAAPLRSCVIAGTRLTGDALTKDADVTGGVVFRHFGVDDGFDVECVVDAGVRLPVEVIDYSVGLPDDVADLVGPRPDGTVQAPFGSRPEDSAVAREVITL